MPPQTALIIGAGIAGPIVALALTTSTAAIQCTIYEARSAPSTTSGAITLSPSALRVLDHLGIFTAAHAAGFSCETIEMFSLSSGKSLGALPFGSVAKYGYASLRIRREVLLELVLVEARRKGVRIVCGKKAVGVLDGREAEDSITVRFEDGSEARADLLVGCDGIHSVVRSTYVEPERKEVYTGVSTACGYVAARKVVSPVHFKEIGMNMGANGSLLTTYCDKEKETIFLAAVMEVQEGGKDGWQARGKVVEEARTNLLGRFETSAIPCMGEMMEGMDEVFFYPVYTLSNGGRWYRGRAILVGDAAHAMPPGGSSAGLAFEDAIILARTIESSSSDSLDEIFARYDAARRPRIEDHYKQMAARWEGTKNRTWFVQRVREFFVWAVLGFIAKHNDANFGYDPMTVKL